jgi:hypothetical protein
VQICPRFLDVKARVKANRPEVATYGLSCGYIRLLLDTIYCVNCLRFATDEQTFMVLRNVLY